MIIMDTCAIVWDALQKDKLTKKQNLPLPEPTQITNFLFATYLFGK